MTDLLAAFGHSVTSLLGYKIFHANGIKPDVGLLFVWIIIGLAGSTLIGMKNRRIGDRQVRWRSIIADLLVLGTLLIISNALPAYLGLMRSLIVLSVAGAYCLIFSDLLYKGKIVKRKANDSASSLK